MRNLLCLSLVLGCLQAAASWANEPVDLPPAEQLLEVLRRSDYVGRQQVLDVLAANRALVERYEALLRKGLGDDDSSVRQQAAMALAAFGRTDPPVLDELMAGIGRRRPPGYFAQPEDARGAQAAIVRVGAKAVPALVKAMQDESYAGRDLALEALGEIGPAAKEALPAIERGLREKTFPPSDLLEARWRIDGDAPRALRELLPLLEEEKGRECNGPLRVLVRMGAEAAPAMPALVETLRRHKNGNVLRAVSELAPHAREEALPALREALADDNLADDATLALRSLGEDSKKLIPHQLKRLVALEKGEDTRAMRIVYTIVIWSPEATAYAPEFFRLLKHENPTVRRAATWSICRLGADDKLVEAALLEAAHDSEVAEEAARSLQVLRDARQ